MSATSTIELSTMTPESHHHDKTVQKPNNQTSNTSLTIPSTPTDDEQYIALAQNTEATASNLQIILTILQPSLINFFSSFTNGIITVGLPVIARSIDLPRSLYLWPSSVFGLTSGAMLLIAGAVADLIGARSVELVGVVLLGAFTLACGLVDTGIQLVVFRALQGVALAMHLPASVSIIAAGVPSGKARNVAFACLGLSQPLGFSVGLVLSGIMIERAGWRSGFYLSGGSTLVAALASFWVLPKVKPMASSGTASMWKRVWNEVDWFGGVVASAGLAILTYVLA
jgi:MFS family permease